MSGVQRKFRIKLKSFDQKLLDMTIRRILSTIKGLGEVVGPFPLPTKREKFTVLKSPHVYKKSREQFQLCTYSRLIDIYVSSQKAVTALSKIDIPNGIGIKIS